MPELTTLFIIAALVAVAGFLRGLAGFGSAMLLAAPLMSLLEPTEALALIVMLEVGISVPLLQNNTNNVNWSLVKRLVLGALITTPLGVYALSFMSAQQASFYISILVVSCAIILLIGVERKRANSSAKDYFAGICSGFTGGLAGVAGPPVVLYLLSGKFEISTTRASLIFYFVIIDLVILISLLMLGELTLTSLMLTVILLPVMVLAGKVGIKLVSMLSTEIYKNIALSIIVIGNIIALLSAVYKSNV